MLSNTNLTKKLKKIVSANPEIEDILLFGSVVRGKKNPQDIDILILFKVTVQKSVEYTIRKILEQYYPTVSIVSKTNKDALDPAFDVRESILFEAKSLLSGRYNSSKYGFNSLGLFRYDFKDWNKLTKTKFYYALNGRGTSSGVISSLGCIKLSDSLVVVPLHSIESFREFLEFWKLEYKFIPLLLPERLNRKDLLVEV